MGELTSYIAITFAIAIWCLLDAPAEAKQVLAEDGVATTAAASNFTTTTSSTKNVTLEVPRPILDGQQHGSSDDHADIIERNPRSQRPTLIDIAVQASAREGLNAIAEFYGKTLPDIVRNGQLLDDNHPAALLSKFSAPDEDSERREMAGFATVLATKAFRKNYKYINELARQAHTPKISLRRTALEGLCPPRDQPTCMPASERYRTHDGTCNNKRRPRWGAAQMPFNRFLPPEYGDGVDSIRSSVDGGPLSSSRFVSLLVHGAKDGEAGLTLMTVQWGQLLDHDLTATAQPRSINGSVPSCCGSQDFHPSCFPIKVPLDDPWLAPLKVRCLEFLRSAAAQRRDCVLSWREQTNQATSYIDASPIYSNSAKSSDNARVFRNGLLIYGRGPPADDVCQRGAIEAKCIRAGDGRSSEQPGLLAMHHVWVSEHNRIATELSEMNLHWSDEKIYQETRRIVGAMFQHITYREFLPIILGREVCKLFDLELLNSGYYEGYDTKANPTVANSFAAAAFRFGHSLVQNSYMRCDHHHNVIGNNVSLHEEFQRGDIGSAGSLHRLLRGMSNQRTLKRDEFITPELTNHLFQTPGFPFGLDLAAINIQRGRDHGIPPYTSWRVPCGLSPINTWDEFANVVGPESARRISHAYRSVHDVDLFVGGIAERPVVGGLVGPTFACIIAQQFSNSRKGDRFWYENGNFESSFTPAQLHSIRRVSLAQVLCRTVGGGTFQPHIFIPPEFPGNSRLPCGVGILEPIDLSPWLEQDPFVAPPMPMQTESPERFFDIVPTSELDTANTLTAMQVIKENEAGFPKRPNAFKNFTTSPHIHFIPNSSSGFHRPHKVPSKNSSKVNDKLDMKTKGGSGATTQKRPSLTVVNGINNKLDTEKNRVTLNANINRHRVGSSTRRTVVVNNIPIELRSATVLTPDLDEESTIRTKPEETIQKKKKNTKRNKTKTKEQVEARNGVNDEANSSDEDDNNSTTEVDEEDVFDIFFTLTEPTIFANTTMDGTMTEEQDQDRVSNIELDKTDNKDTQNHETKTIPKTAGDELNVEFSENSNVPMDKDIDPMTHSPTHELKRVQRKLQDFNIKNEDKQLDYDHDDDGQILESERSPRLTQNSNKNKPTLKTNLTSTTTKAFIRNRIVNVTVSNRPSLLNAHKNRVIHKTGTTTVTSSPSTEQNSTTATKISRKSSKTPPPTKTTTQNIELRHYQTPGGYTRPHKVIVDGPNADQYEIEINIRQTNKSPPSRPNSNYAEYTTVHTVDPFKDTYYGYDRYPIRYPTSTLQPPYYQAPPPTLSSQLNQNHYTKPPTIIYLNEHDERTTTRQPGFLQNFFTFATGTNSGNRRPYPSSVTQKEKPQSQTGYDSSSPHSSHIAVSAAPQFLGRPPQSQAISSSSFSQANIVSGSAHASSSAVTNGHYGSIVGVASANGADSTFSFNIRPRPGVSVGGTPKPLGNGAGSYGLLPPLAHPRPEFISHPETYYEKPSYSDFDNSPFSSGVKQPPAQSYYTQTHDLHGIHKSEPSDYDEYLSRTLESLLINTTDTSDLSKDQDNEDYQYEDYDENVTSIEQVDGNNLLGNLFKIKEIPFTNDSCDMTFELDDNYVLRVLNISNPALTETTATVTNPTTELMTNFADALSKKFNNDILADEDYDTTGQRQRPQVESRKSAVETGSPASIAFAPIRILTQPERPDTWINFDISSKQSILPESPFINEDSMVASEIPKPINGLGNIRLLKGESGEDGSFKSEERTQTDMELLAEHRLNTEH